MSVRSSTLLGTLPNIAVSRAWLLGCIAALLAVVAFREALINLVWHWTTQEEYSHGYLIPLVTGWLLWVRRSALAASIARPAWIGTALVALAMFVHVIGQLGPIFIFSQLAFVVALLGIILATGGFPLLRVSFAPVIFLIFAIPLPSFIIANLSLELQLISSWLGVAFIKFFEVPVYLEGNLIDLGTYKLQVVDACSGLRYLFPLFSLSFLAAYLFHAPVWQRALVLFSSIPITIVMNGFRIGLVGMTVDRWGPRMADHALHFFEGWLIFVASALLILIEISLFVLFSRRRFFEVFGFEPKAVRSSAGKELGSTDLRPLYVCILLICAIISTNSLVSNRTEIIPERSRFVTFPARIGDWQGYASLMEPQTEQILGVEDYILSDYSTSNGKALNLYVAYYDSQHRGKYHSPLVCIPGDGWSIKAFERTSYDADSPINRAIIERNGNRQVVYYWYEERGRRIASEYWSKWYLVYDAITMNRSDGALIRLTTAIRPGEQEQDADARLRQFIRDLRPTLNEYLASPNEYLASTDKSKTTAAERGLAVKQRVP
jgi:exosortase D (VPLPA-CTERM-specific)